MRTKETILIIFIVLLNLSVLLVRLIFHNGLDEFKTQMDDFEIAELAKFDEQLNTKLASLEKLDKNLHKSFIEKLVKAKAISERDTSYNLLYLKEDIKIMVPIRGYLECFELKCETELRNDAVKKEIEKKSQPLIKKYGDAFTTWFTQLKENKLFTIDTNLNNQCNEVLNEQVFEITLDNQKWSEFETFLSAYTREIKSAEYENKKALNELTRLENSIKNQLNTSAATYFSTRIASERNSIVQTESKTKTYSSANLGTIDYTIDKISIDKSRFQSIADNALEEQWRTNSLNNGSMPYAYCYGSSNYCNDYGCSQIQVRSGGSDVLVTIKTMTGRVYRHAYILAGRSFTFNVADGSYQVFFYSGKGWNPYKYIKQANCGELRGGFVSNESVTKDSYLTLYNQIMTYELISQQGGNFSAEQSSKNEAF